MDINKLSMIYKVRKLTEEDIDCIYDLSVGNPMFYQYCPPYVTREGILEDMAALPPGKSPEDKFYIGYFEGAKLVAVMDLIAGYPNGETAFIGLFMMTQVYQGKGNGSKIIGECSAYLKEAGFEHIRLAYAKGNPQSEAFWLKNGFVKTGVEAENQGYTAVVMQKEL